MTPRKKKKAAPKRKGTKAKNAKAGSGNLVPTIQLSPAGQKVLECKGCKGLKKLTIRTETIHAVQALQMQRRSNAKGKARKKAKDRKGAAAKARKKSGKASGKKASGRDRKGLNQRAKKKQVLRPPPHPHHTFHDELVRSMAEYNLRPLLKHKDKYLAVTISPSERSDASSAFAPGKERSTPARDGVSHPNAAKFADSHEPVQVYIDRHGRLRQQGTTRDVTVDALPHQGVRVRSPPNRRGVTVTIEPGSKRSSSSSKAASRHHRENEPKDHEKRNKRRMLKEMERQLRTALDKLPASRSSIARELALSGYHVRSHRRHYAHTHKHKKKHGRKQAGKKKVQKKKPAAARQKKRKPAKKKKAPARKKKAAGRNVKGGNKPTVKITKKQPGTGRYLRLPSGPLKVSDISGEAVVTQKTKATLESRVTIHKKGHERKDGSRRDSKKKRKAGSSTSFSVEEKGHLEQDVHLKHKKHHKDKDKRRKKEHKHHHKQKEVGPAKTKSTEEGGRTEQPDTTSRSKGSVFRQALRSASNPIQKNPKTVRAKEDDPPATIRSRKKRERQKTLQAALRKGKGPAKTEEDRTTTSKTREEFNRTPTKRSSHVQQTDLAPPQTVGPVGPRMGNESVSLTIHADSKKKGELPKPMSSQQASRNSKIKSVKSMKNVVVLPKEKWRLSVGGHRHTRSKKKDGDKQKDQK